MLNRIGDSGHSCPHPYFVLLRIMFAIFRRSLLFLIKSFVINIHWVMSNDILHLLRWSDNCSLFSKVENYINWIASLYSWNKYQLLMMYYHFYLSLNLIWKILFGNLAWKFTREIPLVGKTFLIAPSLVALALNTDLLAAILVVGQEKAPHEKHFLKYMGTNQFHLCQAKPTEPYKMYSTSSTSVPLNLTSIITQLSPTSLTQCHPIQPELIEQNQRNPTNDNAVQLNTKQQTTSQPIWPYSTQHKAIHV